MAPIWLVLLLSTKCLCFDMMKQPLVFDFMKPDPHNIKIYWHPQISVKKVTQLANREISYVNSEEKAAKWRVLVRENDDDDGTKRYIFLKNALCDEVDWKVSWIDKQDKSHGPIMQRMPPSPTKWAPEAKISMKSLIYSVSKKKIILKTKWTVTDEKLEGKGKKLSEIEPVVELKDCKFFFKRPVESPKVLANGNIEIPAEYAHNWCSVWIRLSVLVANEEEKCRENLQTVDSLSLSVALTCGHIGDLDCPDVSGSTGQQCDMDCNPFVTLGPHYRPDKFGYPQPIVNVSWTSSIADRPNYGSKIRHVQIDRTHENFPIKEFNVTVENFAPGLHSFTLEPYSRDYGASFGVQTCVLYETSCKGKTVDWSKVGQKAVFFNKIFQTIPPPPRFIRTTTVTTEIPTTTSKIEENLDEFDRQLQVPEPLPPIPLPEPPKPLPEPPKPHPETPKPLPEPPKPLPETPQPEPETPKPTAEPPHPEPHPKSTQKPPPQTPKPEPSPHPETKPESEGTAEPQAKATKKPVASTRQDSNNGSNNNRNFLCFIIFLYVILVW